MKQRVCVPELNIVNKCLFYLFDTNMIHKLILAWNITSIYHGNERANIAINEWIRTHCWKNYKIDYLINRIKISKESKNETKSI